MKTMIDDKMTVGELVRRHPQVRAAMEGMGIDYCCGGGRTIAEVAAEQGVGIEALTQALDESIHTEAGPEVRDWNIASAAELVDHIVSKHHAYMKRELPRIAALLARVERAHRPHIDMLEDLEKTFVQLRQEIEIHLEKEEQVLFPLIREIEAGKEGGAAPGGRHSVRGPIGQMEFEHQSAGAALARLRQITNDYTLPEDACESFSALYDGLKAIEADLHEHIHLENNILFPKAGEMERIE